MKLEVLRTATRSAPLDLRDARGLVAFVSETDAAWGEYLAAIRAALVSRGRLRGRGSVVRVESAVRGGPGKRGGSRAGGAGPAVATVGSSDFESILAPILAGHALRREEFAAVWLGTGRPGTWLSAGVALLHGPETTRRVRGWGGEEGKQAPGASSGGGDGEPEGSPVEDGPEDRPAGDAPAAAWIRRMIGQAASDVQRFTRAQVGTAELEERWKELREAAAVQRGDAEAAAMAWVRERQDAETRLLLYRDREKELRARLKRIREADRDAGCVNCGQPLGDRLETVKKARREEWEDVVQDGKWWRQRRDQLELKPDELREIESRALSLSAEIEDLSEELERRKLQALELTASAERLEQLQELEARIVEGPNRAWTGGIDPDEMARLVESARERIREKVHAKLVALTGGRFAGAFPELYADWIAGNRGNWENTAALEVAARITLAEIAVDAGMKPGSILLPTGLERLNGEDLSRVLADLVRLTRRIPLILVKAAPRVAARVPESFDLLCRLEDTGKGQRVRRQRPGPAEIRLQSD